MSEWFPDQINQYRTKCIEAKLKRNAQQAGIMGGLGGQPQPVRRKTIAEIMAGANNILNDPNPQNNNNPQPHAHNPNGNQDGKPNGKDGSKGKAGRAGTGRVSKNKQ